MAIEFKCSNCGKELFAQEQYAGMRTTCPGCQTKMPIPFPATANQTAVLAAVQPDANTARSGLKPDDSSLIDMEKIAPAAAFSKPPSPPESDTENPSEISDATKRCPMCAETIKAAAKKCRYCGEILDEELKRDETLNKRRDAIAAVALAAKRSNSIWRGLSVLVTMLTAGWLVLQTLNCVSLQYSPSVEPNLARAPWTLYVFNVLLIGGLIMLIRQMKNGPYHVFLAAALAIVACMPLDLSLGFPLQGLEKFAEEAKKSSEVYKDWTMQDFYYLCAFGFSFTGMVISLPVWFTALKVGLQARESDETK